MSNPLFTAETLEGQRISLGRAASFQLYKQLESPAYSLEALFPLYPGQWLRAVRMEWGGGFWCNVDEQQRLYKAGGSLLRLSARSAGSLALDNEALPQSYYGMRLQDIFRNHLAPYGLRLADDLGNPRAAFFQVQKGMSEWQAFTAFCRTVTHKEPFLSSHDTVAFQASRSGRALTLSNTARAGAQRFLWLEECLNRSAMPSVLILQTEQGYYSLAVHNPDLEKYKLRSKRYVVPAAEFAGRPSQEAARRMRKANQAALRLKVALPGLQDIALCTPVAVQTPGGLRSGLYVHSVAQTLEQDGLYTLLELADMQFLV